MAVRKPKQDQPKRSFTSNAIGFTPIEIGEEITGKFVSMRLITIPDRDTREKKQVRAYNLETENGPVQICSKALLDQLYDEVVDAMGPLNGKDVTIRRGEDVDTVGGQSMSTWTIDVL